MKISTYKIIYGICIMFFVLPIFSFASESAGTIKGGVDTGYAWSENVGYVNFGLSKGGVVVTDASVTGYAWDNVYGWLKLGPIVVDGIDYGIKNTSKGILSGYAWSAGAGWINFDGITINEYGKFEGITEANSIYGRITFNCSNYCYVGTDWRPAANRKNSETVSGSMPPPARMIPFPELGMQNPEIPPKIYTKNANPINNESAVGATNRVVGIRDSGTNVPGGTLDYKDKIINVIFSTDNMSLRDSRNFTTKVDLVNLENEKVNVEAVFTIENSKGDILYKDSSNILVDKENEFIKKYQDLILPNGLYTAKVHLKYNNIEDGYLLQFNVKTNFYDVLNTSRNIFWITIMTAFMATFIVFKVVIAKSRKGGIR